MEAFTPTILRFASLPSTNTEAARQAALGAPEGLCVVAREQTAGRGRYARTWVSPRDAGLYCSTVLRPRFDASRWPLLTLAAALAVHDALIETCALDTDIKWPNDLLAPDGRKLCGILAETVTNARAHNSLHNPAAIVIGIGINLSDAAFPPELSTRATSVAAATGTTPAAEALLRALLHHLSRRYAVLHDPDGDAQTVAAWSARSSYAFNKHVVVETGTGVIEGHTRGLDDDGALRIETNAGDIRLVRAGEVTLKLNAERSRPSSR